MHMVAASAELAITDTGFVEAGSVPPPPPPPVDDCDASGPNNDLATATPLSGVTAGRICPGDRDIYYVAAGAADAVSITFSHALGDLDMRMLAPDGTMLDHSIGSTDSELIVVGLAEAYIEVYGYMGSENNSYEIRLQ
jgi:hypothetical protein